MVQWVIKLLEIIFPKPKQSTRMSISHIFNVLKQFEGNEYKPYVPPVGKSGVTLGIGVDIGHMNFAGIIESNTLLDKISPYYAKFREEAEELLAEKPLELTKEEIDYLSTSASEAHLDELQRWYDAESSVPFTMLTDNQQAVLMSVKYQYGNIRKRTPKFWGFCVNNDWAGAYNELMNFGDSFPTRRRREAALLAKDFNQ